MAIESPGEAIVARPVVGESATVPTIKPRAYQQEMLAESLRQNTIVAVSSYLGFTYMAKKLMEMKMETGSGKTQM